VEIYVAIVVMCFLGHPVEMLPVLAAAFVSVLFTVQFFCVCINESNSYQAKNLWWMGQFMSVWTDT